MTVAISWLCALASDFTTGIFHTPPAPGAKLGGWNGISVRVRVPKEWTIRTWHERRGPGIRSDIVSECEWMGSHLM